jgi:hypothetical protein
VARIFLVSGQLQRRLDDIDPHISQTVRALGARHSPLPVLWRDALAIVVADRFQHADINALIDVSKHPDERRGAVIPSRAKCGSVAASALTYGRIEKRRRECRRSPNILKVSCGY